MISLNEAYKILQQVAGNIKLSATTTAVNNSLGHVIIQNITSKLDLPPFNKSAMDGYAILKNDEHQSYKLLETVAAGQVPTQKLTPGTTIKIMTGAPVPENTDQVIRLEYVTEKDDMVTIHTPEPAINICPQGEDIIQGQVILQAPKLIDPVVIANLISCGVTEVEAIRKPRVAILTTGDEIVDDLYQCTPGKIMNSNGPMLASLCQANLLEVVCQKIVADTYEETVAAIKHTLDNADIVVLSGGVSVGEFDFVGKALDELDVTVHFNKVAVKPGKPMTFASNKNTLIFGLPGNPVSVYLMFHLFVLSATRMLAGIDIPLQFEQVTLSKPLKPKQSERIEFKPAKLNNGKAELVKFNGSAHLLALLEADGFVVLNNNTTEFYRTRTREFSHAR